MKSRMWESRTYGSGVPRRHRGDEGRSFGGDWAGRPTKQPYAAVAKIYGSEQLGKRLSNNSHV